MRFSNQSILITGAASGIGAQTAQKMQAQGARIIALDLNKPDFEVDAFFEVDMADLSSIDGVVQHLDGPIHGLMNIAGIPPRPGNAALVLQVNLFGLRHLTEQVIPLMAEGSAIINLASRAGAMWLKNIETVQKVLAYENATDAQHVVHDLSLDDTTAYNLSKEALIAWTIQKTAQGLPHNIRMNSVSPGATNTAILGDFLEAFDFAQAAIQSVGRATQPEEVADLVCFLASTEAAWIKGTDVGIDGGIFANRQAHALHLV